MLEATHFVQYLKQLNHRYPVEERLFLYGNSAYQGAWSVMGAYKSAVNYLIISEQK